MINERYLEYLALDSVLQGYMSAAELTIGRPRECTIWYADNTPEVIDLHRLKKRVTELQKEFLEPYVIDSTSKE